MPQETLTDDRGELHDAASLPLPEESGLPPVVPQERPTKEAAEPVHQVLGSCSGTFPGTYMKRLSG